MQEMAGEHSRISATSLWRRPRVIAKQNIAKIFSKRRNRKLGSLPQVIIGNIHGNAINPGGKCTFPSKITEGTECPEKSFLGYLFSVVVIPGEPQSQLVQHFVVFAVQLVKEFCRIIGHRDILVHCCNLHLSWLNAESTAFYTLLRLAGNVHLPFNNLRNLPTSRQPNNLRNLPTSRQPMPAPPAPSVKDPANKHHFNNFFRPFPGSPLKFSSVTTGLPDRLSMSRRVLPATAPPS